MNYKNLLAVLLGSFWWSSFTLASVIYDSNGIKIKQSNSGNQCLSVTQVQPGVYDIEINNITASQTTIVYTISATSNNVTPRFPGAVPGAVLFVFEEHDPATPPDLNARTDVDIHDRAPFP